MPIQQEAPPGANDVVNDVLSGRTTSHDLGTADERRTTATPPPPAERLPMGLLVSVLVLLVAAVLVGVGALQQAGA